MSGLTFDSVFNQSYEDELVSLCSRLIRMRSVNPPGSELAIAQYIADVLRTYGLTIELIPHFQNRASLLARLKGQGTKPGVLFSGHLDTVPAGSELWTYEPFSGTISDGKIWGRGCADMKGGIAAMMLAASIVAKTTLTLKGDLILAFTAGEEVDCLGSSELAKRADLKPIQAIVIAEPSGNDLYIAEKGALWIELTTYGKTAHGSMPELGRNAITMMVELLKEIDSLSLPCAPDPLLGTFTKSINTISGGVKTNVIADQCCATIDMRTVPGQDHASIVAEIQNCITNLSNRTADFRASAKIINDRPPIKTNPEETCVSQFIDIISEVRGRTIRPQGVRYYTDAVALVPGLNAPMIICGPGRAEIAHQPNEYVEIEKLVESCKIYTIAALKLLS
ncbi:MAG: M20 family metallopeptidase [Chitinivibrionales bacterium]|nr:M20 family metallopeptidase [Chitinivibrionales bacterium]